MFRVRTVPLVLAALWLAACSDRGDPLGSGSAPAPARPDVALLPAADTDLVLTQVPLRPGVTVDLHLKVFVDEPRASAPCPPENVVLAVPGFAHTAETWRPYAEAAFADPAARPCAIVALDLPGHGASGLPVGLLFGELTLDDYATALLAVLDGLAGSPYAPGVLMGHSQGGIVIQMAQQRLVDGGSSLRGAAGIGEVVLLAPALPAGIPWYFVDSGAAAQLLGGLLVFADPVLGPHASVPPELWPVLFFSNLSGQLAPGAPTPAQVVANGWNAPAPLYASLQLVGAPPFTRAAVSAGIFAGRYGSRLAIVTYAQDQLIRPDEGRALMQLLTDGQNGQTFTEIGGEFAVHDLHVSDPATVLLSRAPTPR